MYRFIRLIDAMCKVKDQNPDDIDVVAMWADSVMLLDPWRYYYNTHGPEGSKNS